MSGDTVDETLFWIPSIKTLVAGDTIISHDIHLWLADLQTPALTDAWLDTIHYIDSLRPDYIVPGHALSNAHFGPTIDLSYSRNYLNYWKREIQSRGIDYFTPQEIFNKFNSKFPGPLSGNDTSTSSFVLNATAEEFGRGGRRQVDYANLEQYNSTIILEGWRFA